MISHLDFFSYEVLFFLEQCSSLNIKKNSINHERVVLLFNCCILKQNKRQILLSSFSHLRWITRRWLVTLKTVISRYIWRLFRCLNTKNKKSTALILCLSNSKDGFQYIDYSRPEGEMFPIYRKEYDVP